jgi:Na+/phosphate symporter
MPPLLKKVYSGLQKEDLRELRKVQKEIDEFYQERKKLKDNLPLLVERLSEENVEAGHYYIQIVDYLKQLSNCLVHISQPTLDHIGNQHKGASEDQMEDLDMLQGKFQEFLQNIKAKMAANYEDGTEKLSKEHSELLALIDKLKKRQIKRIKNSESGIKVSMLYLNNLDEMKNIVLLLMHTVKSHRDFVIYLRSLKK